MRINCLITCKNRLKKNGNNDFCQKLLISNTDGFHTYAFTYGLFEKQLFFIIFTNTAEQSFNLAMEKSQKSSDKNVKNVKDSFKDSLLRIYFIADSKSCGTIGLKIMKYLQYEDIKKIIKNKDKYIINNKGEKVRNIMIHSNHDKYIAPHTLPRKLVKYIQSIDNVEYHDEYYDYETNDTGKYPGTVYNQIRNKNKIKITCDNKKINTTTEVKQK